MPRFLLPVVVLSFVSLAGFGFVFLRMSPDQTTPVVLFLVTLFLTLAFSLSLIFFFLHQKFFFKTQQFTAFGRLITEDDQRSIFRSSLRRGFLLAVVVTMALVLNRLNFFVPWALVLTVVVVLGELYLWRWR